jgi:hypothetical protein
MTALTLGPVDFEAFEVPGCIAFGGGQRLAVHALPGGVRIVDAMGRDDAPIVWSGVFSGENAGERVRLLDLLRAAGEPLPLAWEDFLFEVVIAGFEARFERSNWIPYRIACVVLSDLAIPDILLLPLLGQLTADLGSAAACPGLDLTAANVALAQPLAVTSGTAAYGQSVTALDAASAQTSTLMASGAAALDQASDVNGTAMAAGQLAQASAAQGYLRRARVNLGRAGS